MYNNEIDAARGLSIDVSYGKEEKNVPPKLINKDIQRHRIPLVACDVVVVFVVSVVREFVWYGKKILKHAIVIWSWILKANFPLYDRDEFEIVENISRINVTCS